MSLKNEYNCECSYFACLVNAKSYKEQAEFVIKWVVYAEIRHASLALYYYHWFLPNNY